MRRKRARRHLVTRQLGQIRANGPNAGGASVDAFAFAPCGETLQPRSVGSHGIGGEPFDACDIGYERVDGIVQVKCYDRSPPNKSERVAK